METQPLIGSGGAVENERDEVCVCVREKVRVDGFKVMAERKAGHETLV